MAIKPVTVSQLNAYLKQIFDSEDLLCNISVVGEISGYSNVRGTAYFTLKDENSVLSCVCFTADDITEFKNGDSVMVVGSVKYYTKGGKLSFNVVAMQRYGESILYQRFLELKAKLENEGYFSVENKIPMPKNIKRIGVVSSEGGAVIQDIINVRTRRNPGIDIVLYPVKVQGENAEYEIANGIKILDDYNVDVIIVARGGGSMEDLQPFNTEIVANATYNCKKFIMSAVGHETDYTIIDFCSDMRAPTPSVAAELLCENINEKKYKLYDCILNLIKSSKLYFDDKYVGFLQCVKNLLNEFAYIEENSKLHFYDSINKLLSLSKTFFQVKELELKNKREAILKLNPEQVLKLGYASLKSDKLFITSVTEVEVDEIINIKLKDGEITTKVCEVSHNGL